MLNTCNKNDFLYSLLHIQNSMVSAVNWLNTITSHSFSCMRFSDIQHSQFVEYNAEQHEIQQNASFPWQFPCNFNYILGKNKQYLVCILAPPSYTKMCTKRFMGRQYCSNIHWNIETFIVTKIKQTQTFCFESRFLMKNVILCEISNQDTFTRIKMNICHWRLREEKKLFLFCACKLGNDGLI